MEHGFRPAKITDLYKIAFHSFANVCQDYHLSKGRGSLASFLVVCSCFSNLDENKACVGFQNFYLKFNLDLDLRVNTALAKLCFLNVQPTKLLENLQ